MHDTTKKSFDESINNIVEDQKKIKQEIEKSKMSFTESEKNLHTELDDFHSKNEEKKHLLKKLESLEVAYEKMKTTRANKQKEMIPTEKQLQDSLKKANEQLKKYEQGLADLKDKKVKMDAKLKQLQSKRDSVKEKLNAKDEDEDKVEPFSNFQISTFLSIIIYYIEILLFG